MEMQRDMRSYVSLRPGCDPLTVIADFAHDQGFSIDTCDLLALDTVLDTSKARTPARIVRAILQFALFYFEHCHNPRNYAPSGYFDPQHRHLWRAH